MSNGNHTRDQMLTTRECRTRGYLAARRLTDGRVLAIVPLIAGYQIAIGYEDDESWADQWDYAANLGDVVAAWANWQPELGINEPCGWVRHPRTGRRRPGGDPALEYVHP